MFTSIHIDERETIMYASNRISTLGVITLTCVALMSIGGPASGEVLFSVSPGGPSGLPSEFVFKKGGVPVGGGPGSGLVPGDVDDGFSQNKGGLVDFLLCFSVDPSSTGDPAKPPVAGFGFPPFNVTDQAMKGQAAGDAFISTEAYSRAGGPLPVPPSMGLFNNVLAINQAAPYVDDFGLLPAIGPGVVTAAPLDDVNGGGVAPPAKLTDLFFTLGAASPSLTVGAAPYLGGSGADVFFDRTPDVTMVPMPGDEKLFAAAAALGLAADDEIDALIVFDDTGEIGDSFAGTDQVLFSLARGSPSLGAFSPADIFSVTPGAPFVLFASHADVGLLPSDNVNMLELVALNDMTAQQIIALKVPEPATISLLALAGLMLAGCRRRRRR